MTDATVAGVLVVCLALGCIALSWVIKKFKSPIVRAYQTDELGLADPIGGELKELAVRYSKIQDAIDINGQKPEHMEELLYLKKQMVRIGRELEANTQHGEVNLSSCAQKT